MKNHNFDERKNAKQKQVTETKEDRHQCVGNDTILGWRKCQIEVSSVAMIVAFFVRKVFVSQTYRPSMETKYNPGDHEPASWEGNHIHYLHFPKKLASLKRDHFERERIVFQPSVWPHLLVLGGVDYSGQVKIFHQPGFP